MTTPRRRRGPVELAVRRTVRAAERVSPAHDSLAATAVALAASMDLTEPGRDLAAVARELRITMEALTAAKQDRGGDELDRILAGLSSPVLDAATT